MFETVTIYATGVSGTIGRHLSSKVVPIKIDLRSTSALRKLPKFSENDVFIHLAGMIGPKVVEENLEESFRVNVDGTINLASYFLQHGGRRFIYISSSHIYAKSNKKLDENAPIRPSNSYANQKLKTETLLKVLFEQDPDALSIVRVFSVLDWEVPSFTLGGAIAKLADPESVDILKFGLDVRDFLTPKQIAAALEKIASATSLSGVFNLCGGQGLTVLEAAQMMLAAEGIDVPLTRIQRTTSDTPHIVGDNSKLTAALPGLDLKWVPSRRI